MRDPDALLALCDAPGVIRDLVSVRPHFDAHILYARVHVIQLAFTPRKPRRVIFRVRVHGGDVLERGKEGWTQDSWLNVKYAGASAWIGGKAVDK